MKTLVFKDIDYLNSPDGWLNAILENRMRSGYSIRRDHKEIAWIAEKCCEQSVWECIDCDCECHRRGHKLMKIIKDEYTPPLGSNENAEGILSICMAVGIIGLIAVLIWSLI